MQGAYPRNQQVPAYHAIHVFMHAVSANPTCQLWLNTVSIDDKVSPKRSLQVLYRDFIASEGRRLGNDRSHQPQHYHDGPATHKSADCYLNPKNKVKGRGKGKRGGKKPESANPAAAANAASKGDDNLWVSATHVDLSASASSSASSEPRFRVTDSNGTTHDLHDYDNQPALSSKPRAAGASLAPGAFPAPRSVPTLSDCLDALLPVVSNGLDT
ncbi:hypothetical protein ACN38_g13226 [Penicillium nordicum]|uniref:Uncharacterized protein n=1 Tax=Penicillium nordicum TaxID=229535 RepID=A0A0M8NPG7_9EURO|nr:hypothetical protein ACN38_g13226 [Penicillium nordicum]